MKVCNVDARANAVPNGNQRGNTGDRRARKLWLLSPEAGWGGDDRDVPCRECGVLCEYEDLVADRIIPWCRGGTYVRANLAPHCHQCSHRQGQRMTVAICSARRADLLVGPLTGVYLSLVRK